MRETGRAVGRGEPGPDFFFCPGQLKSLWLLPLPPPPRSGLSKCPPSPSLALPHPPHPSPPPRPEALQASRSCDGFQKKKKKNTNVYIFIYIYQQPAHTIGALKLYWVGVGGREAMETWIKDEKNRRYKVIVFCFIF